MAWVFPVFICFICLVTLAGGAPCTVLGGGVSEIASAAAAGLRCGLSGTVCDNVSGACRIVSVRGIMISGNVSLTMVSFPFLVNVTEGVVLCNNTALLSVVFPRLSFVDGGWPAGQVLPDPESFFWSLVMITGNSLLRDVSFASLSLVRSESADPFGGITLRNNARLVDVLFPVLSTVTVRNALRGITIENNQALLNVSFPSLLVVQAVSFSRYDALSAHVVFSVRRNQALKGITCPVLATIIGGGADVSGPPAFSSLLVQSNFALEEISFPALQSISFQARTPVSLIDVSSNPKLASIMFGRLTNVPGSFIIDAPALDVLNCTLMQTADSIFVSRALRPIFPSLISATVMLSKFCLPGLGNDFYFWSRQAIVCVPCPDGFFSPLSSQTNCTPCPSGQGSSLGAGIFFVNVLFLFLLPGYVQIVASHVERARTQLEE